MIGEDSYHYYGTALEALEEDEVPSKKPIYVEDQIVTDENGRRRFHGAFTGGFSAGYWNTVGSEEGWTPQSFKSSRYEKAPQCSVQRPEDFMDDEDKGEFGIAPERLQVREEFAGGAEEPRKRKLMQPSSGPIPGVPVLHEILKPQTDKVAVRMMKKMGWRHGQGVGARQTRKQKKKAKKRNERELYVLAHYGVEMSGDKKQPIGYDDAKDETDSSDTSDDADDGDEITYAPDDYETYPCVMKNNRFGIGYKGLSRDPVLSDAGGSRKTEHFNLFGPLEVVDKNNKKLSISGQGFGVGALEEEDDDIYARDDMSKYDFSLEDKPKKEQKEKQMQDKHIIDGFVGAKNPTRLFQKKYTVELPTGFKPRNWNERRSRFEPLDPEKAKELNADFRKFGLGRHDLKPEERGELLGEEIQEAPTTSKQVAAKGMTSERVEAIETSVLQQRNQHKSREARTKELLERISSRSSNFTRGGIITAEGEEKSEDVQLDAAVQRENKELLAKAQEKTKNLPTTVTGNFKPFLNNEAKQKRYEEFLEANMHTDEEITKLLTNIQPVELSEWDREMEKKEFIQAKHIYKPLGGIMSDRFISEATIVAEKSSVEETKSEDKKVVMQRTKTMWKPSPLLCKRYNIAEPFGGAMLEDKPQRKAKLSVFDYLETSVNTKVDFQTPVIIPKHIEQPKPIVRQAAKQLNNTEAKSEPIAEDLPPALVTTAEIPITSKTSTSAKQPKGFVPKTDLEKRVIDSVSRQPFEKIELYKAIFEDDSDVEVATNEQGEKEAALENAAAVANSLPARLAMPTSAAAANLLRNTSPPRGIFAALFSNNEKVKEPEVVLVQPAAAAAGVLKQTTLDTSAKVIFKPRNERSAAAAPAKTAESRVEEATNVYGPKLPVCASISSSTTGSSSINTVETPHVDDKLLKLLARQKSLKYVAAPAKREKWVEKTRVDSSDSSESSECSSKDNSHANSSKQKKSAKKKKNKEHDKKLKKRVKKKSKKYEKQEKSHKKKKSKRK